MIQSGTSGSGVEYLHLLSLRQKLQLEIRGMKGRYPRTTYSLIKKEYGLRGSRQSVLRQFTDYIEMRKDANQGIRHEYVSSNHDESVQYLCQCGDMYKSGYHMCLAHEKSNTKAECICKEGR